MPTATEIKRRHPKTTRPEAGLRREAPRVRTAAHKIGKALDALPDRIDLRDFVYRPTLQSLPPRVVNCAAVPEILDQGEEGACTGFALAAVVQYHLGRRGKGRVSPRMLYELARRYDEWPGENYEGSSARGAMKAWTAHGVCSRRSWPDHKHGTDFLTQAIIDEARGIPGGAYYRVRHRAVRDMHAAIAESGILYVTLMVHSGWGEPSGKSKKVATGLSIPTIVREGSADSGHAVAFVGYTEEGFIVQNSWGDEWGEGGFALLPYEDYLIHSTDVWVAQVGVPITIDLWSTSSNTDMSAGLQRATPSIPLADIRPYVVNAGNNGLLSDTGQYWTTEADLERLFNESIPAAAKDWSRQRVLLYLHGGLNSETEVARRVIAFRDVCLANEIYPIHVMWESGAQETLRSIIRDALGADDRAAGGVREWLAEYRDHLVEAKDHTFELTVSRAGTAMWNEMKENARLASARPDQRGTMQLLVKHARAALEKLPAAKRRTWELHVVGHSAGCIYASFGLDQLTKLGVNLKSISLMAPALTVALFKQLMLPRIEKGTAPMPSLFVLSDDGERDDQVGPYGKSLLYLVSNAFESRRETPLLGMQRFIQQPGADADRKLSELFSRPVGDRPAVVVAGVTGAGGCKVGESRSDTHGGFDNDEWTLNSILWRILDAEPKRPFSIKDLQY
jgi:hypothetical protein